MITYPTHATLRPLLRLVAIAMLLCSSHLSFGQGFGQFHERLHKRCNHEHAPLLRDKFQVPAAQTAHYTPVPAHRSCYTMEADADLRSNYPHLGSLDDFERALQRHIDEAVDERGPDVVITIPVVVHVVHNGQGVGSGANISQAQVLSQIAALNEDFRRNGAGFNNNPVGADAEIEFAMALVDPQGNLLPEPGIHRVNGNRASWTYEQVQATLKPSTSWDPNRYLNMWTVQFGGSSDGLLGYAQFPSLSGLQGMQQNEGAANTDGVVIRWQAFGRTGNVQAPYNGGRTTTHEVGHWLGLRHIWGDGNCGADDFCGDTPNAGQPNYSCVANNSCGTTSGDMIENYMDYSTDACMNIFTQCQKGRMRAVMDNSPRRKELKTSTVHIGSGGSPSAPVAQFTANRNNICSGQSVQFTGQSPNSPSTWTWTFYDEDGALLGTFNGQNQTITFNTQGIYSVQLAVTNAAGSNTHREDNYIVVLSSNSNNQLIEDSENLNTAFQDWLVYNPDGDRTFEYANVSSYGVGARSIAFDNYSTDDDPSGTVDALITPAINIGAMANPYLYFEHAYAQFDNVYSDTLVLYYSTDCGQTFTPFWYKGGADLATAPATQSAFVPNANQWSWNQVNLGFLAGQSSVHFLLVNLSGWGNYLYLDEISFVNANSFSNGAPSPNIGTAYRQVCAGETIQFQDYSSNFPQQWLWQFPGGQPASSNIQHPFVTYNTPGTYNVGLTASNAFGSNSGTAQNYIQVLPLPTVSVSASQVPACGGAPVTLTASGASSYQWYDQRSGNLIFEGSSLTVTLYEGWEFEVVGTNSAGCSRSSLFELPVSGPAVPTITQQGSNTLSSSSASSYQWYLNGNPIPAAQGGTAQSIQAGSSGSYVVEVFNASGCARLSNPFPFNLMTSADEAQDISRAFSIAPNPSQGLVQMSLQHEVQGTFEVQVFNALGQVLYQDVVEKRAERAEWSADLSHLPAGLYSVVLRSGVHRAVGRLVRQ